MGLILIIIGLLLTGSGYGEEEKERRPEAHPLMRGAIDRPGVALSDGRLFLVWSALLTPATRGIRFRTSPDGGATFAPPVSLTSLSDPSSWSPDVAVSGDTVYIAWREERSERGPGRVIFRRSLDGGKTFTSPARLSLTLKVDPFSVRIMNVEGNPCATWGAQEDIFLSCSPNRGGQFLTPLGFVSQTLAPSRAPAVAVVGRTAYMVWVEVIEQGNAEIFYRRVTIDTSILAEHRSTSLMNISHSPGSSISPRVAASGQNVAIVWREDSSGHPEIWFARSMDGGMTFSSPVSLSATAQGVGFPDIAFAGEDLAVVWQEARGGNVDIVFRHSGDGGETFDPPVNLSRTGSASLVPALAGEGNRLALVWREVGEDPLSSSIILLSSSDKGKTFAPPVVFPEELLP